MPDDWSLNCIEEELVSGESLERADDEVGQFESLALWL